MAKPAPAEEDAQNLTGQRSMPSMGDTASKASSLSTVRPDTPSSSGLSAARALRKDTNHEQTVALPGAQPQEAKAADAPAMTAGSTTADSTAPKPTPPAASTRSAPQGLAGLGILGGQKDAEQLEMEAAMVAALGEGDSNGTGGGRNGKRPNFRQRRLSVSQDNLPAVSNRGHSTGDGSTQRPSPLGRRASTEAWQEKRRRRSSITISTELENDDDAVAQLPGPASSFSSMIGHHSCHGTEPTRDGKAATKINQVREGASQAAGRQSRSRVEATRSRTLMCSDVL